MSKCQFLHALEKKLILEEIVCRLSILKERFTCFLESKVNGGKILYTERNMVSKKEPIQR